jgi:methionyl-tRNA formyltransferase
MRVVLFGCGSKATAVLKKLIELKEDVVGLVYSELDAHELDDYGKTPQKLALKKNIAVLYRDFPDITGWLRKLQPDVIFVVGWRYKIPKEQYSIPSKGTIVFHDSLLPKYRGFAPMNWAIINGEIKIGATMFYIADEVDSGDVISQREFPISEFDNAKDVEYKMTQAYIDLLTTQLPLIKLDKVHRVPQVHNQATYTCKRVPEDGLIDWNDKSIRIHNLIRGLTEPYPGAFTYLHDGKNPPRKMFIWKSSIDDDFKRYVGRIPGRVVETIKGKGVKVLAGYGTLIVEEVGFVNGQMVRADDVIKSIKTTLNPIDT